MKMSTSHYFFRSPNFYHCLLSARCFIGFNNLSHSAALVDNLIRRRSQNFRSLNKSRKLFLCLLLALFYFLKLSSWVGVSRVSNRSDLFRVARQTEGDGKKRESKNTNATRYSLAHRHETFSSFSFLLPVSAVPFTLHAPSYDACACNTSESVTQTFHSRAGWQKRPSVETPCRSQRKNFLRDVTDRLKGQLLAGK